MTGVNAKGDDANRLRSREPGVYEITTQPGAVSGLLIDWGWQVGVLDVNRVGSRRALLREIGRALNFPQWYHANLYALADCLRDLSKPTVLVLHDWPRPGEVPGWNRVRDVFNDRVAARSCGPSFAIVLDRSG